MSEALKLCPFCGKKPSIERSGPGNLVWYVECEGEEPEHTISMQSGGTQKEAIAAWNTRPVEDALVEALKKVLERDGYMFVHDALKAAGEL
jgi:hypothetical protein